MVPPPITPPTDAAPTGAQLDRRAELLAHCGSDQAAELARLTEHLGAVMASPELVVRRVRADEPPEVLDRLVRGEPVHPFGGPEDLADRLDDDRRCFVLEHPALVGRPLNVVWVALWQGTATDIAAVLDPDSATLDPQRADTAVFYSIWNVEPGLVGLPGGRRLLEGAVAALRAELAGLATFVTLSPIPGLRRWLEAGGEARHDDASSAAWSTEDLVRAAARYLTTLRDDGRPLDAVARFHLGNGARLVGLCPDADRSARGMDRSLGVMANYRYEPEDRAANRRALRDGRVVLGEAVAGLL